ncbi:Putative OTU domain, papain-like cysteine peptidase superfamily [Septoria linicola]|uniref:OTU domain, papain-like cysteine peptidase superfamily n=1 Tax=Septoria linicola TaxID=215465 RepID=A0A9Q9EL91_9PEZI|nr:putative OTU domain, papain-like cysteine peptidase superfamily [Septoria linicola]USW53193.1 Putative OTU domain, papain-like cysteine peptidase superfamily [Septoria linicola]
MDELQARHKKELRDLQSRVTQKKKQASKKTRKAVNDECEQLERDLKAKHVQEAAELSGEAVEGTEPSAEEIEALTLQVDEQPVVSNAAPVTSSEAPIDDDDENKSGAAGGKKRNRQKDRLARRAAEQEQLVRQAAEEAANLPDMKEQERTRMLESMKEHKLVEKEIRADGHCLYSAFADQLEQLDVPLDSVPGETPTVAYKAIRAKAADYIQQHEDDFVPFLEEPLPDYVHKVRNTGEWGGQLELMALAKTYGVNINVLQDFGRVEKVEGASEKEAKTIWLGYYKHGFGLGEHYNSLRKAP